MEQPTCGLCAEPMRWSSHKCGGSLSETWTCSQGTRNCRANGLNAGPLRWLCLQCGVSLCHGCKAAAEDAARLEPKGGPAWDCEATASDEGEEPGSEEPSSERAGGSPDPDHQEVKEEPVEEQEEGPPGVWGATLGRGWPWQCLERAPGVRPGGCPRGRRCPRGRPRVRCSGGSAPRTAFRTESGASGRARRSGRRASPSRVCARPAGCGAGANARPRHAVPPGSKRRAAGATGTSGSPRAARARARTASGAAGMGGGARRRGALGTACGQAPRPVPAGSGRARGRCRWDAVVSAAASALPWPLSGWSPGEVRGPGAG